MRSVHSRKDFQNQAIKALRELLGQTSVIKLKEIRSEADGSRRDGVFIAEVDVLGRRHTLTCEVKSRAQLESLCSALNGVRERESAEDGLAMMRVVIAPYIPPAAQALCKQNRINFLDLDGNARIALGEVFIGRRRLSHRDSPPAAQFPAQDRIVLKPIPPHIESHTAGSRIAAARA